MTHGRVGCDRKAASRSCERRLRRHARLRGQGMARAAGPSRPGLRSVRSRLRTFATAPNGSPGGLCAVPASSRVPSQMSGRGLGATWSQCAGTAHPLHSPSVRARAVVASILRTRLGRIDMLMALAVSIGGVIAFLMVLQSRIALLSFIPGAFIGAAVTVGSKHDTATDYVMTAVSLILGGLLGYVSEALAGAVAKKA